MMMSDSAESAPTDPEREYTVTVPEAQIRCASAGCTDPSAARASMLSHEMEKRELQTHNFVDFRFTEWAAVMNGQETGERFWKIEEIPMVDGKLMNQVRFSDGTWGRIWFEEYDDRRFPEYIEGMRWPDLAWAQLAAVAAVTAGSKGLSEYLSGISYAAKILDLPRDDR